MSEFVVTLLGELPPDWVVDPLCVLTSKITDGAHFSPAPQEEGEVIANVKDMRSTGINFDGCTRILREDFEYLRRQNCSPSKGDVLLSKDGTIGRVVLFDGSRNIVLLSSIAILKPLEQLDSSYLKHVLTSSHFDKQLYALQSGSALKRIVLSDIKKLLVPYPCINKQRKIANILSTLDSLIEKTQALIDKYKLIKQGMMHDLFTRGVDENRHLRPSYEEAPHLYKESDLGWIPTEWKCERVGNYLASINQGWSPDCESEPAEQGRWGVLKTTAVTWSGYDGAENKALPINLAPRPEHEVTTGDVLVTRAGPNSRVGVVAYVYETRSMLMLSDKLYRLVPNVKIEGEFLSLALSCDGSQSILSQRKTGLAESQTNISQSIVKDILIPVPSLPEQIDIARRVRKKDILISKEIDLLSKMKETKLGLMQDLLTGKVRVKFDA